ncbi:MAG: hypothetical protein AB8I08_22750 [Sandaracinaceae bacterium]
MSDANKVLEAVVDAVDRAALARALSPLIRGSAPPPPDAPGKTAAEVLRKIVLSDILDDSILGARPGDTTYPLRMFFGTLGDELEDETAFALANGLNFFFRVNMEEEAKLWLGLEVSRLYYRYGTERPLDAELLTPLSPLLARLMSTQMDNLAFEAVDNAKVFDSAVHEREMGSAGSSARISAPKSFLCRVVSNGRVRAKAVVRT